MAIIRPMRPRTVQLSAAFFALLMAGILAPRAAYPVAYEASTLHNAVSRSETVQGLFAERWKVILDRHPYVDIYGRINWIPAFKVNTVTMTGEERTVPMTLVRTYGSLSVILPVGPRKPAEPAAGDPGDAPAEGTLPAPAAPASPARRQGLALGFTATGFHYGLTRQTTVNRGDAGSETVTDYKYTQFFDDILALSLLYRPYFHVHGGVIVNNQIEPNDDGTMDYTDKSELSTRWFVSSELFDFLTGTATALGDEVESFSMELAITELAGLFTGPVNPSVPRFTLIFKRTALYNDEPFDPVWVRSAVARDGTSKDATLSDNMKERAALYTLGFLIEENYKNRVFFDVYSEVQKPTERLMAKSDDERIDVSPLREVRASLGYNFFAGAAAPLSTFRLLLSGGASRYWDVAAPLHRERGEKYLLYGGFASLKLEAPWIGIELRASYNHSVELRRLVECAEKAVLEGSFFASI
ncbi:MAG: hypothetical protein MUC76_14885 [Spirochaetes bacterium]|nr:hypothetical protein [Spirochaetota bacterium]